jgi:type II secretory pathway pseudopilin PulG
MRRVIRRGQHERGHADPNRRSAFTILELLTVIGVMALLVSQIIPAVQSSREAARQTVCRNHLRQLALAVHNHHDVTGALPPADIAAGWTTWAVQLLPYLDQGPAYSDGMTTCATSHNRPPAASMSRHSTVPVGSS